MKMGMRLLPVIAAAIAVIATACASIGRPQGGPRDETPPVFVRSNPAPGSTRFGGNKIDAIFDENLKLEDVVSKVVVSPAQKQMPSISANGKHLTVELKDTLLENTTYTIDFGDAIRDLNEGNILDGFALDFATGDTIDSLRISGIVLQASNLEPAQGMLVGVYDAATYDDTTVTTLPMSRIARTNQLGQFTIRNLKAGSYRVFAMNDVNRDYHWDRSEDIAFYPTPVTPTVEEITVTDTLRSASGGDSIVTHGGVRYLPNDLLLTWFNENYTPQYLKDYQRPDSNRITITMAAHTDTLPRLEIIDGVNAGRRVDSLSVLKHTAGRDTLEYWMHDPLLLAQDTMTIAVTYQRTDTLEQLSWTTDTLKFNYKRPKAPKKKKNDGDKKAQPKDKKSKKQQSAAPDNQAAESTPTSLHGDSTAMPLAADSTATSLPADSTATKEPADTLPEPRWLEMTIGGSTQELNQPITITVSEPVATNDLKGWHLEQLQDSTWLTLKLPALEPDTTGNILRYTLAPQWTPGTRYRLTVDSLAVTSIYGHTNKPLSQEISTKALEEYSSLKIRLNGAPDSTAMVVELLNNQDNSVRQAVADGSGTALLEYVAPGTYYLRAYADSDGDGKWTTGDMASQRLPEDVWYYTKKINLKKNWDITQDWDLNETAVDLQKPSAIKKNKPKTREKETRDEDEDEDEDQYSTQPIGGAMGNPGYDDRNPFDNRNQRRNRPTNGTLR